MRSQTILSKLSDEITFNLIWPSFSLEVKWIILQLSSFMANCHLMYRSFILWVLEPISILNVIRHQNMLLYKSQVSWLLRIMVVSYLALTLIFPFSILTYIHSLPVTLNLNTIYLKYLLIQFWIPTNKRHILLFKIPLNSLTTSKIRREYIGLRKNTRHME